MQVYQTLIGCEVWWDNKLWTIKGVIPELGFILENDREITIDWEVLLNCEVKT